jgi:hypothetical protein
VRTIVELIRLTHSRELLLSGCTCRDAAPLTPRGIATIAARANGARRKAWIRTPGPGYRL